MGARRTTKTAQPLPTWRAYLQLTKPGIIRGNLMTALAGFLFASNGQISLRLLLATMAGIGLVIAGACIFNNLIDRDVDKKMQRTKVRGLVTGQVSVTWARLLGTVVTFGGFSLLWVYTNQLTVLLGGTAFVIYVGLYGLLKRRTPWATVVGSVAGALPITAGYTAVTGQLNTAAGILFACLFLWQMPHFYAIAIFRRDDYRSAGLPVLPLAKSINSTKWHLLAYLLGFIAAAESLTFLGYAGYVYLIGMLAVSFVWLWKALQGFEAKDDTAWARQLFFVSLAVLLVFSLLISIEAWVP